MIRKDPEGWKPRYHWPIRNFYKSIEHPDTKVLSCTENEVFPLIQDFIREFDPEIIVEFGFSAGGMTLCMHEAAPLVPLWAFDCYSIFAPMGKIARSMNLPVLNQVELEKYQRNFVDTCFNSNVHFKKIDLLGDPKQSIIDILESNNRVFLYCDNGNKPMEVSTYARYLKPGDVIGAHDWGEEIDLSSPNVEEALHYFEDHPMNHEFISQGLMVRLFVKRGEEKESDLEPPESDSGPGEPSIDLEDFIA